MAFCTACGSDLGPAPPPICPRCGARIATEAGPPTLAPPGTGTCPNCRVPMTRSGELQFRVGGRTGGSGMLLGSWNQLSESIQPFAVYHCARCGRVDLYESGR